MTTKELEKLEKLEQKIDLLQSAVIGFAGRDPEGEYKPEFVDKIFKALKDKPVHSFKSPEDFLKQVRDAGK